MPSWVGEASGVKAGTGVNVGMGVNVGILVAAGLGVHVGGRVRGTDVCVGWGFVAELPQAGNKISSNGTINNNFTIKVPSIY
jgi:hypothetical protein